VEEGAPVVDGADAAAVVEASPAALEQVSFWAEVWDAMEISKQENSKRN
jgi:hypothetical protein